MTFNLVVPMAGAGSRFRAKGYANPKPLIDVNGTPMFAMAVDNLIKDFEVNPLSITFIIDIAHDRKFDISETILDYYGKSHNVNIIALSKRTEGAAMTVRAAAAYLPPNEPVIIMNCDQYVEPIPVDTYKLEGFMASRDAGMLVFHQPKPDPKWSYASVVDGKVKHVAEKDPISEHATVGIYYWSKASIMFNSIDEMIVADDRTNGEFYLCPAFNYTIDAGFGVGIHAVAAMHSLGTPEDLEKYLASTNV